ncbi:hypothetical protein M409DRAFT_53047 [Zasmidium cellare ATCC 36951]|uniref:Uncharacterized protein n=1 Tax=Zasmidium cellare ATCC 36951 TaxID=1080233 RepID=A0A6A6CMH4_ZASCE|nr:uncharacterized protein M409DRAFT_53047 [Zasmidium cellare ATCC 36951]KAF2168355.1 hypothetical protein M409DRAFT_53047 [Zasmidium cellare ATCC 36951]
MYKARRARPSASLQRKLANAPPTRDDPAISTHLAVLCLEADQTRDHAQHPGAPDALGAAVAGALDTPTGVAAARLRDAEARLALIEARRARAAHDLYAQHAHLPHLSALFPAVCRTKIGGIGAQTS